MASSRYGHSSAFVIAMGFIITTTTWVQLAEARTDACRSYELYVNENFEITCDESILPWLEIVCKSSTPNTWDNLSSHGFGPIDVHRIMFHNCSFPPGLSLLNVIKALGVNTNYAFHLEINQARTQLRREHLGGLYLSSFHLANSNFDSADESNEQLPGDLLHDLKAAYRYIFDNLTLTSVPPDFFKSASNLTSLQLNKLGGLRQLGRHDFTTLKNLNELDLYGNAIELIESGSFDQLEYLISLNIGSNRLHTLPPDVFRRLVRLEELYMSGNEFDELPNDLIRIDGSKLRHVELSFNRGSMRSSPPGFFRNLSDLNYVDLRGNYFTSIPGDVFFGARSLRLLEISKNNLTSLPAGLFEGTSLVEFWASKNRLTSLPEGLFNGIHLEELYLNENLLSNITRYGFSGLKKLKVLDLSHNNVSYIEPQICKDMKQIETIDLSYNQLGLFDREMPVVDSLSVLLNCFHIEKLESEFIYSITHGLYPEDMSLNLERNRFTYLNTEHLRLLNPWMALNLNGNEISMVDLKDLKSVADDYRDKNKMSKNARVSLEYNPLNCDCKLYDFFRYFVQKLDPEVYNFVNIESDGLECASPPELRGTKINMILPKSCTT